MRDAASSLSRSLTDQLRAFTDRNSGDGMFYTTSREFVRDVLRRHKLQQQTVDARKAILEMVIRTRLPVVRWSFAVI